MEEPGGSRSWGRTAFALPRVQSDVMVVTTGGNERGLRAIALLKLETDKKLLPPEGTPVKLIIEAK